MKVIPVFVTVFLIALVFSTPAHAYLDPGTGSMIFQAIIAVFLGAAATGKLWWSKVKGLFSRKDSNE